MNQKGLSRFFIIIIIAVVAVLGVSSYFIFQRDYFQKELAQDQDVDKEQIQSQIQIVETQTAEQNKENTLRDGIPAPEKIGPGGCRGEECHRSDRVWRIE